MYGFLDTLVEKSKSKSLPDKEKRSVVTDKTLRP